jgi:hypothetical protein
MKKITGPIFTKELLLFRENKLNNLTDKNLFIVMFSKVFDYKEYFKMIDKSMLPFKNKISHYCIDIGRYHYIYKRNYPEVLYYGKKAITLLTRNISFIPTYLIIGRNGKSAHYTGLLKDYELELILSDLYVNDEPTLIQTEIEFNMEDF